MPIGAAKLGVLGAGLVPGGTETFNAPGTFSIPPGVKKVSITGRGGTGNPGNAGNAGTDGNPGSGGGGGGAGRSTIGIGCASNGIIGGSGGVAARPDMIARGTFTVSPPTPINPFYTAGTAPPSYINQISMGGDGVPAGFDPGSDPRAGQSGQGGTAGTAGTAGNPGNTGQQSSGLGNTFPGGAGGSAGVAGNAGTGGSGGSGGNRGNSSNSATPNNANLGNGGSGGTGGGSGGNGNNFTNPNPLGGGRMGGGGGGGAGATNSGSNGQPGTTGPQRRYARGGNDAQVSAPVNPNPGSQSFWFNSSTGCPQSPVPTNIMGGSTTQIEGISTIRFSEKGFNMYLPTCNLQPGRVNLPQFSPLPLAPNIIRAGGGGGSSFGTTNDNIIYFGGGGGGGGGRGNAGNAGGGSPTPTGVAGTPQTFNCVPVSPGTTTPITVGTPGGQIVISWNPQ